VVLTRPGRARCRPAISASHSRHCRHAPRRPTAASQPAAATGNGGRRVHRASRHPHGLHRRRRRGAVTAKGGIQNPRKIAFHEGIPAGDPKKIPLGLKRSDLASRDDKSIDAAIATLIQNDGARKMLTERMQRSGRYRGRIGEVLRAWKIPESMMFWAHGRRLRAFDTAGNAVGICI